MVNRYRKNKELVHDLIEKRDRQLMLESIVVKVIKDFIDDGTFIGSAKLIQDEVERRI